ncbi:TadE-like protein [Pseudonocardia sediminis]|uniref:TadE-like protein n=1 Tax=Pseudonocardia sediminis TaxID=1397368 RepID=A0A4V6MEA9_PSEST|nr:TadE family protein [Pseudonocardia sediminis]RZT85560.1 TadE-like protein [Pseudonocardia sediminis]
MGERGGSASVEMALLWGVLMVLILAVVQVALVFYAGQLALTAAQDGLRSGRYFATESVTVAASRDANDFLRRAAGSALTGVDVSASVDDEAGLLRVRVTGTALSLVPGVPLTITREAVGGLERVAQ